MVALTDLLTRKAELERQIESLSREQRGSVLVEIRALMAHHGLTVADLAANRLVNGATKPLAQDRGATPKYRDPDSGGTWGGRGPRPKWLKTALDGGRKLEDFSAAGRE